MIALAYAVALAGASAAFLDRGAVVYSRITVRQESIIRVPQASRQPNAKPVKWKERDAPSCIPWSKMAGAMISSESTIDVIIKGGTRYRVKLEKSCQSIDFYSGFYVKARRDGMVCEDRDMIHSRSGGACMIGKFKTLVQAK